SPLVKKQARNGGGTGGARPRAARLLVGHGDLLAEIDERLARGGAAWTTARGGELARSSGAFPERAFAAAVGHARVVADDDLEEVTPIARVPLGFAALASGDQ